MDSIKMEKLNEPKLAKLQYERPKLLQFDYHKLKLIKGASCSGSGIAVGSDCTVNQTGDE